MTTPSAAATFLVLSAGVPQPGAPQSGGQDAASGGFLQALAVAALAAGQKGQAGEETGEQILPAPLEETPPELEGKEQATSEADASAIPPAAPVSIMTAQIVPPLPEDVQSAAMPGDTGLQISAVHQESAGRTATSSQTVTLADSLAGEETSGAQVPRESQPFTGGLQDPEGPLAANGAAGQRQSPLPASGLETAAARPRTGQHPLTEGSADHPAFVVPAETSGGGRPDHVAAVLPDAPEAAASPDVAETPEMLSVAVRTAPQSRMRIRESSNDRAQVASLTGEPHSHDTAEAPAPDTGTPAAEVPVAQAASAPDAGPFRPEAAVTLRPAAPEPAANEPASPALEGAAGKDTPSADAAVEKEQRPASARPASVAAGEPEGSYQVLAKHIDPIQSRPMREERSERPASSGAEVKAPEAHTAADALRNLREVPGTARTASPERPALEAVDPPRLVDQVVRAVELTRRGPATDLTVQLDPPELGVLRVKVTLSEGAITAHVRADSPDVHRLLLTGQSELRDALQQAGLRVDEIRVPQFGSGFADPGRQSQPRQEYARPRRSTSAPSLEGVRSAAAFAGMSWLARTDSRALVDRFA
ncbi:MAG: flagellar hook-length control protein FliK [Armatimonadota bacterium]